MTIQYFSNWVVQPPPRKSLMQMIFLCFASGSLWLGWSNPLFSETCPVALGSLAAHWRLREKRWNNRNWKTQELVGGWLLRLLVVEVVSCCLLAVGCWGCWLLVVVAVVVVFKDAYGWCPKIHFGKQTWQRKKMCSFFNRKYIYKSSIWSTSYCNISPLESDRHGFCAMWKGSPQPRVLVLGTENEPSTSWLF